MHAKCHWVGACLVAASVAQETARQVPTSGRIQAPMVNMKKIDCSDSRVFGEILGILKVHKDSLF